MWLDISEPSIWIILDKYELSNNSLEIEEPCLLHTVVRVYTRVLLWFSVCAFTNDLKSHEIIQSLFLKQLFSYYPEYGWMNIFHCGNFIYPITVLNLSLVCMTWSHLWQCISSYCLFFSFLTLKEEEVGLAENGGYKNYWNFSVNDTNKMKHEEIMK